MYTKGKWVIEPETCHGHRYGIKSLTDKQSICAIASTQKRSLDEKKANAHLIAAAPALLEALERLLNHTADLSTAYDAHLTLDIQDQALEAIRLARNNPDIVFSPELYQPSPDVVGGFLVHEDGCQYKIMQQGKTRVTDGLTYLRLERTRKDSDTSVLYGGSVIDWYWIDLKTAQILHF